MTVYVMTLRVDTASAALPEETDGEALSRLLFDIAGHVQGLSTPVRVASEHRRAPTATPFSAWAIHPEEEAAPTAVRPEPPAKRRVIITRRENFERMERLGTLSGDGPMIAMPDYTDHESEDWLPEGMDLKTFANDLARMDPAIVAVRPADPYHRKNRA